MSAVTSSIEHLYRVFSGYSLEPRFEDRCSPIGDRRIIARRLENGALRSLSAKDLAIYAFKAGLTMGDVSDFKYFLPRILEVCALDPKWRSSEAMDATAFAAMDRLDYASWPRPEREAIRTFAQALWPQVIHASEPPMLIRDFGVVVDVLELEFGPLLASWLPPWPGHELDRILQLVVAHFDSDTYSTAGGAIEAWLAQKDVWEFLCEFRTGGGVWIDGSWTELSIGVSEFDLDQAIKLGS